MSLGRIFNTPIVLHNESFGAYLWTLMDDSRVKGLCRERSQDVQIEPRWRHDVVEGEGPRFNLVSFVVQLGSFYGTSDN